MSVRSKLKRALQAIESAKSNANTAANIAEQSQHYARCARNDLEKAETEIRSALRQLPETL